MNPELYQRLASRTECDQDDALYRMADGGKGEAHLEDGNTLPIRVNHAVIGLMGEVGELASAVEKWIYYGQDLDRVNISEEVGDCLWYLCLICNALGLNMAEVMEANILKLKTRYPEKFSTWESANRDLVAERQALEGIHSELPGADVVSDPGSSGDQESVYDQRVVCHDTGPTNPSPAEIMGTIGKATDTVVAGASRNYAYAILGHDWRCSCGKINAPYDKECTACGRVSPLISNDAALEAARSQCEKVGEPGFVVPKELPPVQSHSSHDWESDEANARCRKCRAHRSMESGCMSCPVRPYIVQGEASSVLMKEITAAMSELGHVQPHSSHEWDSDKVNAQCLKCGGYKHLGSGFLRCRGTARVDDDQPRQQNGHGWVDPEVIEGEY